MPVVVYDNPGTTHVAFSDELHARISRLPRVAAIKIPPVTGGVDVARARVDSLRSVIAPEVRIGISGDAAAADALVAGCDAWYSVLAGTLPGPCRAIVDATTAGDAQEAQRISGLLDPLWRLFGAHGSYRVVAALAEDLGLVAHPSLPRPVLPLDEGSRADVHAALASLRDDGLVVP
ncbi:dihydrodipicolinate synthase family protein [Janibacter indicus]|uniref:dihydrodipicolinate synthase family protein n=1 Tax=Janibacter indicus TaxID=857417 RepID=UPI00299ECF03|nr:dihydrodipicolinate synthase family protein [Janibacter indicus]